MAVRSILSIEGTSISVRLLKNLNYVIEMNFDLIEINESLMNFLCKTYVLLVIDMDTT
jgi:hypothetical protein